MTVTCSATEYPKYEPFGPNLKTGIFVSRLNECTVVVKGEMMVVEMMMLMRKKSGK